jgi:hypothetical protein
MKKRKKDNCNQNKLFTNKNQCNKGTESLQSSISDRCNRFNGGPKTHFHDATEQSTTPLSTRPQSQRHQHGSTGEIVKRRETAESLRLLFSCGTWFAESWDVALFCAPLAISRWNGGPRIWGALRLRIVVVGPGKRQRGLWLLRDLSSVDKGPQPLECSRMPRSLKTLVTQSTTTFRQTTRHTPHGCNSMSGLNKTINDRDQNTRCFIYLDTNV